MIKNGAREKNLNIRRKGQQNKAEPAQNQSQCLRSRENLVQFFEFLKDHHALQNRSQAFYGKEASLLQEISGQMLCFFNEKKDYTIRQLDRHIVYLANLLGVLGVRVSTLTFKSEFKIKIKKLISSLKEEERSKDRESSVQQALFYILALLIYREGAQDNASLQTINKSIYSDRKLVKELLSFTTIVEKKTKKFFGVILMNLCAKFKGKYIKEDMMECIFKNLGKFEDESIFFQLLAFLRREMNRSNINLYAIKEGQIVKVLLENYLKYSSKKHSYLILEYLNYLISLFPTLAKTIYEQKYYEYIFHSCKEQNSEKQAVILKLIDQILNFVQLDKKSIILDNFLKNIDLISLPIGKKLLPLIIKHVTDQAKLANFLHDGLFSPLFEQINVGSDEKILKDNIYSLLMLAKKLESFNYSIHFYLKSVLKSKIDCLSQVWKMRYQHLVCLDEQSQ